MRIEMSDDVLEKLILKTQRIEECLCTALAWIAGSANSPLSVNEVKKLYDHLNGEQEPRTE